LCMSILVHVQTCTCPYLCKSTRVHVQTCTCPYVCMSTRVHVHTCTCSHVYMSTRVHVQTCACPYVCMSILVHVHTCTCPHVCMSIPDEFYRGMFLITPSRLLQPWRWRQNVLAKRACAPIWPQGIITSSTTMWTHTTDMTSDLKRNYNLVAISK
jgi:hypothetical protein